MLRVKFRIVPELIERPAFLKEGEVFKLRNHSSLFPHFDWPTEKEWHILPETYRDFHERVKETLQKIPIKSIVVTHYGYISLTTKLSLTKSVLDDGFPPASIIYFNKQNVKRLGCIHEEVL